MRGSLLWRVLAPTTEPPSRSSPLPMHCSMDGNNRISTVISPSSTTYERHIRHYRLNIPSSHINTFSNSSSHPSPQPIRTGSEISCPTSSLSTPILPRSSYVACPSVKGTDVSVLPWTTMVGHVDGVMGRRKWRLDSGIADGRDVCGSARSLAEIPGEGENVIEDLAVIVQRDEKTLTSFRLFRSFALEEG